MATEWFYTTNKQQMGPVSWNELRELAEVGILKPHDMVWSEGMEEWVKAINQGGLFADEGAEEKATSGKGSKKSSYSEAKPPPGRRTRPREEDEDEEEDDRDARKKARKSAEERTKMAMGLKIGLILAAVVFGLVLLGGCGLGLVWISLSGRNAPPPANNAPPPANNAPRKENYTVRNLQERKFDDHRFTFTQGKTVTITVRNNVMFPNTDVDLWILRGNNSAGPNERPIANDDRLPNEDPNCRVQFVVPATDTYRVRVINRGPGVANACEVQIEER